MQHRTFRSFALLMLAFGGLAQAQYPGPSAMPSVDPAMCDQLAAIPNAPMTVEACRTLLKVGRDDPGGNRPGDDALSCSQIYAEIQTTPGLGVSDAEAARTEALLRESQTLDARMGAQTMAAIAPESAALTALGMLGGVLPNAVASAAAAAPVASMNAKTTRAGQENLQERRRLSDETASVIDARLGNPRVAHLSKLAMAKGCALPEGSAASQSPLSVR